MKLRVDFSKCSKSGECYYNHPDLLKRGDDYYPVVMQEQVPVELEWEARSAAGVCPTEAIIITNDDGSPLD